MPSDKTVGYGDDAFNVTALQSHNLLTFIFRPSSLRLVLESTSLVQCLWTSNPQSSMKSELELTASCSILSSSSAARKMLPTTMQEDITPLERSSSILPWTGSESSLTSALDSKDSLSSTRSGEELDLDSVHF